MNVGLGFREEDVNKMLVAALNSEVRVGHLQFLSASIAKQELGEGQWIEPCRSVVVAI